MKPSPAFQQLLDAGASSGWSLFDRTRAEGFLRSEASPAALHTFRRASTFIQEDRPMSADAVVGLMRFLADDPGADEPTTITSSTTTKRVAVPQPTHPKDFGGQRKVRWCEAHGLTLADWRAMKAGSKPWPGEEPKGTGRLVPEIVDAARRAFAPPPAGGLKTTVRSATGKVAHVSIKADQTKLQAILRDPVGRARLQAEAELLARQAAAEAPQDSEFDAAYREAVRRGLAKPVSPRTSR